VDAVVRCSEAPVAIFQGVEKAAMPDFPRIKADVEGQSAIGILCLGRAMRGSGGDRADEIAVLVAGPKLLLSLRPRRGDPAAAYDLARFHLENVRKVATHRDLELEACLLHVVVGDVEILVHAAIDAPAEDEAERALRDDA